ncbi:MAG: F0F1 ATP synthase subunit B, partial [Actinomycetota bacterium]|nr:F0F1 ATP synthase subunit B [Actinomycetota bacterium]
ADAARVRAELREQADREVERIQREGAEQLATAQAEATHRLREEVGGLSTRLAERIVGDSVAVDGRSTVGQFLAEVEQAPAGGGAS